MFGVSVTETIKYTIPTGDLKGFIGEKNNNTVLPLKFWWSSSYFQQSTHLLSCGEGLTFPKLNDSYYQFSDSGHSEVLTEI